MKKLIAIIEEYQKNDALAEYIEQTVYESVLKRKGSISAEHGVGSLKRDKLPHYKNPVALSLMRAIKTALDPQGLMNPGRVI